MSKNNWADIAQEIIDEIFQKIKDFSDEEYIDCLEEIAGTCEDAAKAKQFEIDRETKGK